MFRESMIFSPFGPFDVVDGYRAIIRSLGQACDCFRTGAWADFLGPKTPASGGLAALIVMTADLAAANSRYILTAPQSIFETKPEVVKVIEEAERADPSPGPFRIHRMRPWNPESWSEITSQHRFLEIVSLGS